MTDKEWADKRCAEREIVRLASEVAALKHRLAAAEGATRAATIARDIAMRLAATHRQTEVDGRTRRPLHPAPRVAIRPRPAVRDP